jgi:hypothetical protein
MQNPQDPAKSSLSSGDSEMHQENTMQEDSDSWPEDNWEPECGGCNNLREQLEALSANRAFEMETLSQHRFLISKLQDESEAQRSQIVANRVQIDTLQLRLDQLDDTQPPTSNTEAQQGYSRNAQSNSINQMPDLNVPLSEFRRHEQHSNEDKNA